MPIEKNDSEILVDSGLTQASMPKSARELGQFHDPSRTVKKLFTIIVDPVTERARTTGVEHEIGWLSSHQHRG